MRTLLSYQNKKLGEDVASFALPTTVCKLRNIKHQGCNKYCYAKKMENIWKPVRIKWRWNLKQSLRKDFLIMMKAELTLSRKKIIRVHVGGDFYNQKYLDLWLRLANEFPKKTFFTYTKAVDLDFSKRPKNFKILFSDDSYIFKNHHDKFDGVAVIKEFVQNKVTHKSKGWSLCPGDCRSCNKCWATKRPLIIFHKH